ncbi:MAG: hypothetical protein DWQ31_15075 [Planctomycetota bacterium]|nr:MAG: hypothetical protein DWQ31_15075 [Planctomycetota bacterium]REJ96186.1 MAG: hypothetical protein DWQ35_04950 [Planctomycetota bacterium]
MKTQWVFNRCEDEKDQARSYWDRKVHRLEKLLSNYAADLRRLRLTVHPHKSRDEWRLRGVLRLPTGTLVAQATSATLRGSIDEVVDKLVCEIRRHKGELRKEHLRRRRHRRREQLAATAPFLAEDASAEREQDFVALLLPHLDQVHDHARRELTILELENVVPRGDYTARDLVDDVLVQACDKYDQRPHDVALDVWLLELLTSRLEDIRGQLEPITLVAPDAGTMQPDDEEDNADLDDLHYWFEQTLQPTEPLSLEELLTDDDVEDISEKMSAEEQRDRLNELLAEFPTCQRQAWVLRNLYGFETHEIARALDRCEADIQADIETARDKLRMALTETI